MTVLAVLMTCHDRRETTLACLRHLHACALPEGVSLRLFLVDDGCSDGTGEAVQAAYPDAVVLYGDGSLYWNGGMRLAFDAAMQQRPDYYLWLNDDTFLYPHALVTLLEVSRQEREERRREAIVVGSTQSQAGGTVNHGGVVRWRRLKSRLVEPGDVPVPCESMYGNCVLIPDAVARVVGNLDPAFVHSIGDVDYGLRARRAGFEIVVMPGFAATCSLNPVAGSLLDVSLPLKERYRKLLGPKGLPPRPFAVFLWRHFKLWGMLYGTWVYSKIFLTWLASRARLI